MRSIANLLILSAFTLLLAGALQNQAFAGSSLVDHLDAMLGEDDGTDDHPTDKGDAPPMTDTTGDIAQEPADEDKTDQEDDDLPDQVSEPSQSRENKINNAMDKAIAMILGTKDTFSQVKDFFKGKRCMGSQEEIIACEVGKIFDHEIAKMNNRVKKLMDLDNKHTLRGEAHLKKLRSVILRIILDNYKYGQMVTAYMVYEFLKPQAQRMLCTTYTNILKVAEYQFTITDTKLMWKGSKELIYKAELQNNPTLTKLGLNNTFVPSLVAKIKNLKPLESRDSHRIPYILTLDQTIDAKAVLIYNTAEFMTGQLQCGQ